MRYESLVLGILVLGLGIYLVSSHGYVGGTYLPGLVGLPAPTTSPNSTTPSFLPGFSVGTLVALSGLGLIMNGIRSPSRAAMGGSPTTMSPEAIAALAQAMQRSNPTPSSPGAATPGPSPGTVYCSRCGKPNLTEARFCNGCGTAMPAGAAPVAPVPSSAPVSSTGPPAGPPG